MDAAEQIESRVRGFLASNEIPYETIACRPDQADTAVFCEVFGIAPEASVNTILVASKKQPKQFAACLALANTRLDVNRTVRKEMGVRKCSFASFEETEEVTGMLSGGVTPFESAARDSDSDRCPNHGRRVDVAGRRQPLAQDWRARGRPRASAQRSCRRRPGDLNGDLNPCYPLPSSCSSATIVFQRHGPIPQPGAKRALGHQLQGAIGRRRDAVFQAEQDDFAIEPVGLDARSAAAE